MKKQLNHRIWDFLNENPELTTSKIADGVGYDAKLVGSALSNMVRLKQVTRTGARSGYKYSALSRPPKRTRETPDIRIKNMQDIFSDIYHHPEASARDISSRVDVSYNTVRKCIRELEKLGALLPTKKDNLGANVYVAVLGMGYYPLKKTGDGDVIDRIKTSGGGVFGLMAAQLT